ncbi:M48 family peptidase [Helicobacter muridarum]|uniref:M48 family peptidase n=1 Tax=Helicobacter muridarum TaxID=216 RepID=A0A099TYY9_9HELI|nr:M48 family metallopeptidase [Helicobacter muridarum]TLE00595.1 M48 family peptidase [Helicobacter muridarum]STQ85612.1 zinc-metallo protease [Helicobacter muridarum]
MYSIIAIYCIIYLLPTIFLNILQIYHIRLHANKEPVILNKQDYIIAANYNIIECKVKILNSICSAIFMVLWFAFGIEYLYGYIASLGIDNKFQIGWYALMCFVAINILLELPFDIIGLKIDTKFGFNKQSIESFLCDKLKESILSLILFGIVFAVLLWIMETFKFWWIISFSVVFCFIILIQLIHPTIIAPMFNKFIPLQDEELKTRIQELMTRVGFKSNGVFVMDASRRDGRLNAYFGGLGKSKRVVIFDTLLDKISQDGLIAILGHELGHFKNGDIIKNIILVGIVIFICFAIMELLFHDICSYMGIQEANSNVIMITILIMPAIIFLIKPIQSYFSRKAEYKADLFGASCVSKKTLRETLIRLVNENKTFPHSHPAYIFFYFSHPPLIDRLNALKDDEKEKNT